MDQKLQKKLSKLIIKKESLIGNFFEDIENTYKFIKELGAGAFGKVYLVEHRQTKKTYACKRLSKKKIKNKESIISEINLLKQLDHPNIVKLFEVYEDKVYLFLVMEELKGGELFDRILSRAQNKNYYSEKDVCRLFKQILCGIIYCHDNGICHRDIKPENIVFNEESESSNVKIIDFGLSKSFHSKNHDMKTRVGTCFYMAPEVIKGDYDEKCDVWSLGVLLYVLVSGRAPFNGSDDNAIIKKIMEGKLEFKWEGWKNISDECKNLIKRMLVDVEKRPTAAEVLQDSWIVKEAPSASDKPLNIELEEIKQYACSDKLSKAISGFVAFRLKEEDVKELNDIFKEIDRNGDGALSLPELKNGLEKIKKVKQLNFSEKELEELFSNIDLDSNGVINYNEFIAATFDRKKSNTKEYVYQAFKTFDVNKDGKISIKELEKIITAENEEDVKEMQSLFAKIDTNGDGEIDFDEFCKNFCE